MNTFSGKFPVVRLDFGEFSFKNVIFLNSVSNLIHFGFSKDNLAALTIHLPSCTSYFYDY